MDSLREHAIPIISALVFITCTLIAVIWRSLLQILLRVEQKLEQSMEEHRACQVDLPIRFVNRTEWTDFLAERRKDWAILRSELTGLIEKFWLHSHNNVKVEIPITRDKEA